MLELKFLYCCIYFSLVWFTVSQVFNLVKFFSTFPNKYFSHLLFFLLHITPHIIPLCFLLLSFCSHLHPLPFTSSSQFNKSATPFFTLGVNLLDPHIEPVHLFSAPHSLCPLLQLIFFSSHTELPVDFLII